MENRVLGMMLRSASAVRQFAQLHQWAQAPSSQQRKTRADAFDGKVVITKDSGVRKRIRALARNGVDPDLLRTMRQSRDNNAYAAMSPDPTRQGMFRDHNCWKCKDGARPCIVGNPRQCEYPHARND